MWQDVVGGYLKTTRIGVAFVLAFSAAVLVHLQGGYGGPSGAPAPVPPFAAVALSTLGLVSLFVSLLYQRRLQRADELIREIAVWREPMHPDYREMLGLARSWTEDKWRPVDPRWIDKHERTLKTLARFREYRQIFMAPPPYALVAVGVFPLLLLITIMYWLGGLRGATPMATLGNSVVLAVTVECLWQLLVILWRVAWLPFGGTDEDLHLKIGLPSWYKLSDARYLAQRFLPIGPFLAAHELYLTLTQRELGGKDHWVLSVQLPLPLREWQWSCTVQTKDEALVKRGPETVQLSPAEADRFFREPGLWLDVPVADWPVVKTAPDQFDAVTAEVTIWCGETRPALTLAVSSTSMTGRSGWYTRREGLGAPLRYPWYNIRIEDATRIEFGLLRPAEDPLLIQKP